MKFTADSIASSFDLNSKTANPPTTSLDSANGPSIVSQLSLRKANTRARRLLFRYFTALTRLAETFTPCSASAVLISAGPALGCFWAWRSGLKRGSHESPDCVERLLFSPFWMRLLAYGDLRTDVLMHIVHGAASGQ